MKGLTLQVEQGEVFGFLGPNGAGKTTSMKMLLGLVAPTSGTAHLLGAPIGDLATRARVGFLPEHFRFQDWLTAREFLCCTPITWHGDPRSTDSPGAAASSGWDSLRSGIILRTFPKVCSSALAGAKLC